MKNFTENLKKLWKWIKDNCESPMSKAIREDLKHYEKYLKRLEIEKAAYKHKMRLKDTDDLLAEICYLLKYPPR